MIMGKYDMSIDLTKQTPLRNILLIGMGRGGVDARIFKGFNQYRRGARTWLLSDTGHYGDKLEELMAQEEKRPWIHGAIGHILNPELAAWLIKHRIPTVDLSGNADAFGIRSVSGDPIAVGEMAADHFKSRHYKSYVFVSNGSRKFEEQRWVGFQNRLKEKGREAQWCILDKSQCTGEILKKYAKISEVSFPSLLRNLPKPLAVLAATDHTGMQVCDLARSIDLQVPEDISVLGVDNFDVLCESAEPPLSSISMPAEKIGFEAARMLDLLMKGESSGGSQKFPPTHVHARASTELSAVEDPAVAKAIRYMREHLKDPLKLPEIAGHVHMHERTFLRHFQKAIGRNPSEELQRMRLELARELLLRSDSPMYEISAECGFSNPDMLTRHLKAEAGVSPTEFRKLHRV
jgi:LacI family transcriptional regulator